MDGGWAERDDRARLRAVVGWLGCVMWVMLASITPSVSSAAGRVALVVGNGDYAHIGRLPNPTNDAADVGAALRRMGFEVTVKENAGLSALTEALRAFARRSADADVALVFYAGHGMEMDGVNYLLPVDAQLERDTDVRFETVTLDDVLASTSGAGLRLVILDACRNNPLAREMRRTSRTRSVSNGSLGDPEDLLGDETLVAYSAAAGTTAADGEGRNSPYTAALLAHLEKPVELLTLFRWVRAAVVTATGGQRPHEYQSLVKEHYLGVSGGGGVVEGGSAGVVGGGVGADPTPSRRRAGEVFRDCPSCPEMVVIPAGTFMMGSPASEEGRSDDEGPQHRVTLRSFALGRLEVTRSEYAAFVTATDRGSGDGCSEWTGQWTEHAERSWRTPGFAQGGGHPVVCVSWGDAQAYAAWLSGETGKSYRLPSESEWEYAARGGTMAARYWGAGSDDQCGYANGADAALTKSRFPWWSSAVVGCNDGAIGTALAGSYGTNDFGLFDVLGNVAEWVEDCWHDDYGGAPSDGRAWTVGGNCGRRALRGGAWHGGFGSPRDLRSASRSWHRADDRAIHVGFRVARTLD